MGNRDSSLRHLSGRSNAGLSICGSQSWLLSFPINRFGRLVLRRTLVKHSFVSLKRVLFLVPLFEQSSSNNAKSVHIHGGDLSGPAWPHKVQALAEVKTTHSCILPEIGARYHCFPTSRFRTRLVAVAFCDLEINSQVCGYSQCCPAWFLHWSTCWQGKLNGRQCVAIEPPKHLHVPSGRRVHLINFSKLFSISSWFAKLHRLAEGHVGPCHLTGTAWAVLQPDTPAQARSELQLLQLH